MVTLTSKNVKKAFSHTVDDSTALIHHVSIIKELRVLVRPVTAFITFHVNDLTITTMVVPGVDTIITLISLNTQITTIDSQIVIRCSEFIPFHYEMII